MEKLYIVTGASGHLGQALVRLLVKRKKRVRILVMKGEMHIPPGDLEVCYGNVCDRRSLEALFHDTDGRRLVVIHMAGVISILSEYDKRIYDVNVIGTDHILEMAMKHQAEQMIYVSSVHAIREKADAVMIEETDDFRPEYVVGHYAKSKAIATSHVLQAAEKGLKVKIVHPSGIIGPYDYGKGHLTSVISDYCKGALIAGSRGGYDFVDVRDVAVGIMNCMKYGEAGQCYILSGHYHSIKELLDMLSRLTGGRRIRVYFPVWFLKLIAPAAQLYYRILNKTPLFTPYSAYTLNSNGMFSHEKASGKWGYCPRPMEETLRDTLGWMKKGLSH